MRLGPLVLLRATADLNRRQGLVSLQGLTVSGIRGVGVRIIGGRGGTRADRIAALSDVR